MNFNKELFAFVKTAPAKFALIIAASILASGAVIGQAHILSKIINSVFLFHAALNNVQSLLILFLIVSASRAILLWLSQYFASGLVRHLKKYFREQIIIQIEKIGPLTLKSERTGELTNTLFTGVDKLEDYFSKFLPHVFLSLFIPIIILIFIFPVDLLTAAIFVVTAPIIPLFMYLIGSIAERMNKKQWESLSRMSAYFFDVLLGLSTLKLFNKTNETVEKIFDVTNHFRIKTMRVLRVAFLSALVLEIAATISVAVIAVSVGLRLLAGNFDFSNALFILIIAPDFYLPLRQLGASYHAGMEGVSAFERINQILKFEMPLRADVHEQKIFHLENSQPIIFNNVSFTYPGREIKALDNISLTILPQKVTALVGATGAGKSSLMNMLLRFINADEGNILIGSENFYEQTEEAWRSKISWLPQNPHIFNTSILENIRISNYKATIKEVINAAGKAQVHDFISSLPQKYDSTIGEYGNKLSGGEIQRIALARAYLRNSPFLFIDEPTANLDPIIEEEILSCMYNLFKGKTVLIIAHRLNTIMRADEIIVMKEGRIVETGTHEKLIKRSGYYNELLTAQRKSA
ncbi:MAG: thiol reductant ABC exporter subunit CydD [Ignavibacteriaceae bacterium]|nr:thiol reductant ABC exporter subunit CydD [Ignavibacteriaceae bacterium]